MCNCTPTRTRDALPETIETYARDCLSREHPRSYLIPVLQKLQEEEGYLLNEHLGTVAELFGISKNEVIGVATFYHCFSLQPRAKNTISVCLGTACHVKGASGIVARLGEVLGIKEGEATTDGNFGIAAARCVGMCAMAPVMLVNDDVYGNVEVDQVRAILEKYGFEENEK